MGRPSLITEDMEDFIRGELLRNPRPKAARIYLSLVSLLETQDRVCPGEDAIIKRITSIRKDLDKLETSPLDAMWSVGACVKYNIPGEYILPLIAEQEQSAKSILRRIKEINDCKGTFPGPEGYIEDAFFTIREAIWYAKLLPALLPLAQKQFPDDKPNQHVSLFIKARLYARKERIAETKGLDYSDTFVLDETILDLSPEQRAWDILDICGFVNDKGSLP